MTDPVANSSRTTRENSPWLDRYRKMLAAGALVLDLGCGVGDDSRELIAYGCRVVAFDLELERVKQVPTGPGCSRVVGDMRSGLPFRDSAFDVVVSSLSIHYFDSKTTSAVIAEIARILTSDGMFLCRVNAIGDTNFGYGQGIEIEPGYFSLPDGRLKRFFTEKTLEQFLQTHFLIDDIVGRTILQHGREKRTLECMARRG